MGRAAILAVLAVGATSACRSNAVATPAVAPAARPPAAAPAAPAVAASHDEDGWTDGATARLRLRRTSAPRHDGSYGAVHLELEALAGRRVIASRDLDGVWSVLAYSPAARAFVIGGEFEVGAWLPLDDISYVDEHTGELRRSRYDDGSWIALAAVAGPGGRYVVFVGQSTPSRVPTAGGFRLQVLDPVADRLYDLGPAPAPPPAEDAQGSEGRCDWGDPVDGLTVLDPGILELPDAHTLRASDGADQCQARANKRRTRSWDLDRVVKSARPIAPGPPELPAKIPRRKHAVEGPPLDPAKEPHF
jgi:hypothetical protein